MLHNNRIDKQFAVGDKVLLSTANLALKILRSGTRKLAPKWAGSFTVIERVVYLGYRLELADTMLVHDVFQVCYLRGYKNDQRKAPPPALELDDEGEQTWELDAVLDHKGCKQGRKRKLKYLMRFTGYVLRKMYGLTMFLTAKKVYRITGTRSLCLIVYMLLSVLPSEQHAPELLNIYLHTLTMSTLYVQCVCS